jgi:hypothetical protein
MTKEKQEEIETTKRIKSSKSRTKCYFCDMPIQLELVEVYLAVSVWGGDIMRTMYACPFCGGGHDAEYEIKIIKESVRA